MSDSSSAPAGMPDAADVLRSRGYVVLLVVGAAIGVPIAAVAYAFLEAVSRVQGWLFTTLPGDLGFDSQPDWWSIPLLVVAGLVVAATIQWLPGDAGHKPAEGFHAGGVVRPIELPGIIAASFVTLCFGVVLGPEAPLIAIGGGLAVLIVSLARRDAPEMMVVVIGGAGSFAAISTLLGSPLVGAFLLMEVAGFGGPIMGVVLLPGLLAAGVGTLIFIGLNDWTGFGTFSLGVPNLPTVGAPTFSQFLWAIAIGVLAALLGAAISRAALAAQPIIERRRLLLTPVAGLVMGIATTAFVVITGRDSSNVLFSGQDQLAPLLDNAADWTVSALLVLLVCKGLAYAAALSSFRGGPVFPGMFLGAVMGIALSQLSGDLPMVAAAGMGIGAVSVAMLRLPLTSVLLVALFLSGDGTQILPVVIVAVVVSYVVSARLDPVEGDADVAAEAAPAP